LAQAQGCFDKESNVCLTEHCAHPKPGVSALLLREQHDKAFGALPAFVLQDF